MHSQQNIKYISVFVFSNWQIVISNIQNFKIKNLSVITASLRWVKRYLLKRCVQQTYEY